MKSNLKSLITVCSITSISIMGATILKAQENTVDITSFIITIENNHEEIILKCDGGCAWTYLTYINESEAQAIDQYGMTELKDSKTDCDLSEFLFTLSKTKYGVSLKGIKGIAWTDLSFTLHRGQKQRINQNGML